MLRLTINNTEIPLPDTAGLSINKALFDPLEWGKRQADFSKTFTLPGTPEINKTLGHIFALDKRISSAADAQFTPDFNPNLKANAKLDVDGVVLIKGFVRLMEIRENLDGNDIEYDLTIFAPQVDFFTQIRELKAKALDFSDLNHNLTAANIEDSWATSYKRGGVDQSFALGEGYVYPIMVREGEMRKDYTNWGVDQMRPAIFAKEIVDKIFEGSGFTYSAASFFNDTRFKKLVIPTSDNAFEVGSAAMDAEEFLAESTTDESLSLGEILKFNNDSTGGNFDTPGTFNNATYRYTTNYGGWYGFRYVGDLTYINPHAHVDQVNIGIYVDGVVKQVLKIDFPASATTTISVDHDFTIYCNQGSVVDLRLYAITYLSQPVTAGWTLTEESGSTFTGTITSATIGSGNELNFIQIFKSNITQEAIISGFCKMFNLMVTVDDDDPTILNFIPYPDFHSSTVMSLQTHLDMGKPIASIPFGELAGDVYKFKYQKAKDAESEYFNSTFGDPYGTYNYNVANDFVKGVKVVEPPFCSTPFAPGVENNMALPYFGAPGQVGEEIHVLIYGGLKSCTNNWVLWDSMSYSGSYNAYTTYPFFGHIDDPFNPTYDISFGMPPLVNLPSGGRVTYTNDNLFNKYWRKYIEQITNKDSRIVTANFRLRPIDWYNISFDKLYQFQGQNFILLRVDDYDPEGTETTQMVFMRDVKPVAFVASTGTKGRGYDNTDGYSDRFPGDNVPIDKQNIAPAGQRPVKGSIIKGFDNKSNSDATFLLGAGSLITADMSAIFGSYRTQVTGERVISILEDDEARTQGGLYIQGAEVEFTAPANGYVLTYNAAADKWYGQSPGAGSFSPVINLITTSDTVTETSGFVVYDCNGAAITLTMSSAVGNTGIFVIKNSSTTQTLVVAAAGAETIDGTASINIAPEDSVMVYSDGTNLEIF